MSGRQEALEVLVGRLEDITVANGYQTDAGDNLFVGEDVALGDDDGPASIALEIGDDEVTSKLENVALVLSVEVQAIVKAGSEAWKTVEAVVADIKTAVEQDHDLGGKLLPRGLGRGSTSSLKREAGSEYVGAVVRYTLAYAEGWGTP